MDLTSFDNVDQVALEHMEGLIMMQGECFDSIRVGQYTSCTIKSESYILT